MRQLKEGGPDSGFNDTLIGSGVPNLLTRRRNRKTSNRNDDIKQEDARRNGSKNPEEEGAGRNPRAHVAF
jgi:hypothetical protein